jgi:hypothetical protein
MARENQVLQISLIVCVMFMIGFGVATFMLYRKFDEANQTVTKLNADLSAEKSKSNSAENDVIMLKTYVGAGAPDQRPAIGDQFKKDMESALASLPEAQRSYRKALEELTNLARQRGVELLAEKATTKSLSEQLTTREQVAKPKIDEQAAAAKAADDKWKTANATYDQDRRKIEQDQKKLLADVTDTRKSAEDTKTQAQAAVQEKSTELVRERSRVAKLDEELAGTKRDNFEKAHGSIDWVDQRNGMVWINLGRDDYLRPLMTFSVYDKNATDVSRAKKKANIEVVQILGAHQAQARIVEDKLNDPILGGDKIYTSVWTPGEQRHFALVGLMDVDGDGKSDLQLVLNLIRTSGGVVDSYREDSGKDSDRRVGKITSQTHYVVYGTRPDEKSSPAELNDFTEQDKRVVTLNSRRITLGELLNRMGYRPKVRKTDYGPGADPRQFLTTPAPGATQKSSGAVSPLFKPRDLSRSAPGTAN